MKKSKIATMALLLTLVPSARAQIPAVDTDNANAFFGLTGIPNNLSVSPSVPNPSKVELNEIIPEQRAAGTVIKYAIKSCEQDKEKAGICEGLKKLAVHGTAEEKREFVENKRYILPKRFDGLRKVEFFPQQDFTTKGTWVQVCEKTNCRWEQVCGYKQTCDIVTAVLCGAALSEILPVGGWVINMVSGGTGGYVCYKIGEKVCKEVQDCQKVEKCDESCHNEYQDNPAPGSGITNPNGQTNWQ